LLPDGWRSNIRVTIADQFIAGVTEELPQPGDTRVDALLPALANLHSHTFQRAMAGMTEHRSPASSDSFWTWRELMYRFLDHLTPEHIEAIAAQAFVEMAEAGFAAVAEFHYLHHQPGGQPYDRLGETSERIMAAAAANGIGLTHLPVLYTYGGAGKAPLRGGQRRFETTIESLSRLLDSAGETARLSLPADTRIGLAPHSLRATSPEELAQAVVLAAGRPLHMHIAEQQREVEEISAWLGARPVEWLLANAPVAERWCLIHATHMTAAETEHLAATGAVAGLCPITESSLGDGIFGASQFLAAGGRIGIGSDSNVRISVAEELRVLEYSQRLRDQQRNVLAGSSGSTGQRIYTAAARGSAQALGRNAGAIETGALADLVSIDSADTALCGLRSDQLLDGWIFASTDRVVTDVWSAGRHIVVSGRHPARDAIAARYRRVMQDIVSRL
jgi:formiminoglutamate deiminase